MGKKKFIDKRNSATFQLFARDSSTSNPAAAPPEADDGDRVFVRVDNNTHYSAPTSFAEDVDDSYVADADESDPYSVFADAPEGSDEDEAQDFAPRLRAADAPLPDHMRKEILELGLPDDGYNYLAHLREIRKSGAGSNYYVNSKAKLDSVPHDVRAYDASRLRLKPESLEGGLYSLYDVAAKTVSVKIEKVADPDVARLLDDSDLSRFGSDIEDLEEDFVAIANCPEEADKAEPSGFKRSENNASHYSINGDDSKNSTDTRNSESGHVDMPRRRRPLDEQFDLLMLNEYGDSDIESENDDYNMEIKGEEPLVPMEFPQEELDPEETYEVPSTDLLVKCAEYARMYSLEDPKKEEMVELEESSEESEHWDCETIVSTYSNLDNHPGRIEAPGKPNRKHQVHDLVSNEKNKIITLGGKGMLPVDFLPYSKRTHSEKEKKSTVVADPFKRRTDESKEEKKERKAAVKEARREARHAKKQLKELYKCESQMAQRVAAISGPSSIRLM